MGERRGARNQRRAETDICQVSLVSRIASRLLPNFALETDRQ